MNHTLDPMTRREVIYTGITAGFALATMPATGWAITTPSDGLATESTSIPVKGGKLPVYRAMPKGKGPFPTVIVIHEIFGVHEYIQDVCRRLAKQGYLAVAPYLYFREGEVAHLKEISDIRDKVVSKVPQSQVLDDLDALVGWLGDSKLAAMDKMAITGFCWGGNVVWMYAAHNPKLKAGIAWYGKLVGEATSLQPKFPVGIAQDLKVPVLGLYGGKDKGIPLDSVEKMREALKKGKSQSEIVVYPEADHAFHADYRPSYHEKSAADGWDRLLKWLREHGVRA